MKIQVDFTTRTGDIEETCTIAVDSDFIGAHQAAKYADMLRTVASGMSQDDREEMQARFDADSLADQTCAERIKELEADAALGRMVRNMPEITRLRHNAGGMWEVQTASENGGFTVGGATPEEALRSAGVTP